MKSALLAFVLLSLAHGAIDRSLCDQAFKGLDVTEPTVPIELGTTATAPHRFFSTDKMEQTNCAMCKSVVGAMVNDVVGGMALQSCTSPSWLTVCMLELSSVTATKSAGKGKRAQACNFVQACLAQEAGAVLPTEEQDQAETFADVLTKKKSADTNLNEYFMSLFKKGAWGEACSAGKGAKKRKSKRKKSIGALALAEKLVHVSKKSSFKSLVVASTTNPKKAYVGLKRAWTAEILASETLRMCGKSATAKAMTTYADESAQDPSTIFSTCLETAKRVGRSAIANSYWRTIEMGCAMRSAQPNGKTHVVTGTKGLRRARAKPFTCPVPVICGADENGSMCKKRTRAPTSRETTALSAAQTAQKWEVVGKRGSAEVIGLGHHTSEAFFAPGGKKDFERLYKFCPDIAATQKPYPEEWSEVYTVRKSISSHISSAFLARAVPELNAQIAEFNKRMDATFQSCHDLSSLAHERGRANDDYRVEKGFRDAHVVADTMSTSLTPAGMKKKWVIDPTSIVCTPEAPKGSDEAAVDGGAEALDVEALLDDGLDAFKTKNKKSKSVRTKVSKEFTSDATCTFSVKQTVDLTRTVTTETFKPRCGSSVPCDCPPKPPSIPIVPDVSETLRVRVDPDQCAIKSYLPATIPESTASLDAYNAAQAQLAKGEEHIREAEAAIEDMRGLHRDLDSEEELIGAEHSIENDPAQRRAMLVRSLEPIDKTVKQSLANWQSDLASEKLKLADETVHDKLQIGILAKRGLPTTQ